MEECMSNNDLVKKLAKCESINDQLAAEIRYLDRLARDLGFANGLKTLKSAALEMLESDRKKRPCSKDSSPIDETEL